MSEDPFLICGSLRDGETDADRCSLGAGHPGSHSVSVPLDAAPTALVKMWTAGDGDELEAAGRLLLTAVARLHAAIDGLGEVRAAASLAEAGVPAAAEGLASRLRRMVPTAPG